MNPEKETTQLLKIATSKALESGRQKESNAVFITRGLNALVSLAENTSVVEAASASSDYQVLLTILETPESLDLLRKSDPLAEARLRGLEMKQQLIEAEGGCLSDQEAAQILDISRQAVDKRRRQGKLIGISRGKHGYLYPAWQFTDAGEVLTGLESVLATLKDYDPWMQTAFLLDPNLRLGGQTPLAALRNGHLDEVIKVAATFGEQGAD